MTYEKLYIDGLIAEQRELKQAFTELSEEVAELHAFIKKIAKSLGQNHDLLLDASDKIDHLESEYNIEREGSLAACKDMHRHIVALLHDGTYCDERLKALEAKVFPSYQAMALQISKIISEVAPRGKSEKFDRRE